MTLSLITRSISDGNGNTFPAKFFQDSSDSNVNYAAPILYDPNNVLGQALAAGVGLLPGNNHVGQVGGSTVVTKSTLTRPNTATNYAAYAIVDTNATAGSLSPHPIQVARVNGGTGTIVGLRLNKTSNSVTGAYFRVRLYESAPTLTSAAADNASFPANVSQVGLLGFVDIVQMEQFSDGAAGRSSCNLAFQAAAGSQNLYYVVETMNAYSSPALESLTVTIEALVD